MKHLLLCHWLLQRRRWLLLIIGLGISALLAFFTPTWLWSALCAITVLVMAMLLIYRRDLKKLWTEHHLRMPAPRDGHAELVMVDAALVDRGPAVLSAAQPVTPVQELSLRMGSGALLLGSAMVHLSDCLPRAAASALISAAQQMNLRPAALKQKNPVLFSGLEENVHVVTVQDGQEERSYYAGDAEAMLALCSGVWDSQVRLMGAGDRSRIMEAAREMAPHGETVYAFATAQEEEAPIFLGLAAIGDALEPAAIDELRQLRAMGLTLILRDDGTRLMDVDALRRQLDIPNLHARPDLHLCITNPYPDKHCLAIVRHEDRSLAEPVRQLREHFSRMSFMLGRLWGMLGLCLMCCVLVGGTLSVPACTAILTAAYLAFGSLTSARAVRPLETGVMAAACLLVRLLLSSIVPLALDSAGTCLCLAFTALLALRLALPVRKPSFKALLPMLTVIAIVIAAQCLMGISLLPAAFASVCGLIAGLIFLVTG